MTPPNQSVSQFHSVQEDVKNAIVFVGDKLRKRHLGPVKRKVFKMIYERLLILQDSLSKPATRDDIKYEQLSKRITETIALLNDSISESASWDIADSLKELLPEVAPPEFIYRSLIEEIGRDPNYQFNWDKYFPSKDLQNFVKDYEKDPTTFKHHKGSQRLIALYKVRNDLGRHDRAREAIRWHYLLWVSALLLVGILAVLFWYKSTNQALQMEVALIGGAIGSVLSRAIRIRDLSRIVELKSAWMTMIPQVIVGATLAMVIVMILQTGDIVIKIGNIDLNSTNDTILFVIGFLSGFSEPFALKIIEKMVTLKK